MVIKRLRTADNSAGMAEKIIKNDTLRIFLDTENVAFIPAVFGLDFQG